MSSVEPTRDDLLDLFEELRRNGFNVGTQQYVAAQKLLVKLAAEGGWLDRPGRLATLFAPIVCTTPEEQESFPRYYERWLSARPGIFAARKSQREAAVVAEPPRDPEPERKPPHLWNRWWLLFAAVPLLLLAAVLIPLNSPSPPTQITLSGSVFDKEGRPVVARINVTIRGVLTTDLYTDSDGIFTLAYSSDDLPLTLRAESAYYRAPATISISKPTRSVRINLEGLSQLQTDPDPTAMERLWAFYRRNVGWTIAMTAVALLGVGLLPLSRYGRRLELRKWRTRNRVKTDQLVVKGAAEQLARILSLRRTAQELRRHRPSAVQDLDVGRTIEGTIREGLFTPTYAARRALPEYLVLVDRVNFDDQQARFVDEAVKRLAQNDVYIERYYFQGDPRVCTKNEAPAQRHTVVSRVSSKDEPLSRNVALQELMVKYPNHNLIVFSDAAGLFNPLTGRAQGWLGIFSHWPTRVVLTSELQTDEYREWALTKSGFMVLPTDRAGLAAVGERIQTGIRLKRGAGRSLPLPWLLRQRQTRWLEEHPPSPPALEELCGELKAFLGGEGYYWLSACAVYPMLYWDLTLYLGYKLVDRDRFDEKLTTLLRLPWFRHGSMPDWLRERLVMELPPVHERAVRGALKELLLTSIRKPDGFVLPIVHDPLEEDPLAWRRAWGRLAKRVAEWRDTTFLLDYLKSGNHGSPLKDHVLLSFIAGRKPNRLALHLPEELYAAFIPRRSPPGLRFLGAAAAFFTFFGLGLLAAIPWLAVLGLFAVLAGLVCTGAALSIDAMRQVALYQARLLSPGARNFYSSVAAKSDAAAEQQSSPKKMQGRRWPFVVGRPLRSTEKLYGRDELLADIAGHLSKLIPVNIVGERRLGKTSLLNHLQAMYEGRHLATEAFAPLLIHIDLQEVGSNTRRFYGVALRKLLAEVSSSIRAMDGGAGLQRRLAELYSTLRDEHDADEFRKVLKAINNEYAFFKLIIVVDEFEALLVPPIADSLPQFFNELRAMMSEGLMTMVIASLRPLSEYSRDSSISDGRTSPFANYFMPFRLLPLGDTEAEALLRSASDGQLTDGEIAEARRWAGGQPCLLQVAAAAWYEAKMKDRPIEWFYQRREEFKLHNCTSAPPSVHSVEEIPTYKITRDTLATLTFAGFALLLAFRDVATELTLFSEGRLWLSFSVCATILALSLLHVFISKQRGLLRKLRTPGALRRAVILGLFSGGIYLGIFYLIDKLGAGLLGLIDYGLIPLVTAIVGWVMFKEKLTRDFFGAFLVYLVGLSILMLTTQKLTVTSFLGIAVLLPVASALSDGFTKWLLDEKNAGLTKAELLVVRFLPATLALYVLAAVTSNSFVPQLDAPSKTIAVAVVGGWAPLMLLCTGLGVAGMKKLAVWEFMIPAITFFGTLYFHPEHVGLPILGALLILSGIIISELKVISRLKERKAEHIPNGM